MKYHFLLLSFSITTYFTAQTKMLQPWTGAVYEKSGISCEEVEMEIEGQNWISNVLPIGKELEVKIKEPKGFVVENGVCFPGVSILVTKLNGDTLGYAPNIFPQEDGLDVSTLRNLSFSFALAEKVNAGDQCRLDARFFDTKSSNYLRLKMDLVLEAEDVKPVSDMSYSFSSSRGYKVNSTVNLDDVGVKDTLVKQKSYTLVRLSGIAISWDDLNSLEETMLLYDPNFYPLDSRKILADVSISKKENPATKKYDLELFVPKNNDIGAAYWTYRLENKSGQVIEIFNPF
ncbi:MAG: hypothetical protein K0R65_1661 [Crocinitomicaceae bacterium]|jgi:hypothetical protein|nr:hypothetical protein [Crocinitomicaceae bacterium]